MFRAVRLWNGGGGLAGLRPARRKPRDRAKGRARVPSEARGAKGRT